MSRRIPLCLAGFFVAFPAWAAPPGGDVPANGAIAADALQLTMQWNEAAQMPAGVLMTCRARVVPVGPGANAEPAETSAVFRGAGAQCALEIPLAWHGSAPAAVEVIYEMDAISAGGTVARTGTLTVPVPHMTGTRLQVTVDM